MDLDEFWWRGGLAKDVYQLLFEEEQHQVLGSGASSSLRISLVHWILQMSRNSLNQQAKPVVLGNRCVHMAVMLMDLYLDYHDVVGTRENYVLAGTCLRLAAKFDESDVRVPTVQFVIGAINAAIPAEFNGISAAGLRGPNCKDARSPLQPLTAKDFKRMEMVLLHFVNYRLMFPTAPCFVPYFLSVAFATQLPYPPYLDWSSSAIQTGYPSSTGGGSETGQSMGYSPLVLTQQSFQSNSGELEFPSCFNTPSPEPFQPNAQQLPTVKEHLSSIVDLLLELSLQDISFSRFRRSLLAASCISASRQLLGLSGWTPVLIEVTGYSASNLFDCTALLFNDLRGYLLQLQTTQSIATASTFLQLCYQSLFPSPIYNPYPSPPLDSTWPPVFPSGSDYPSRSNLWTPPSTQFDYNGVGQLPDWGSQQRALVEQSASVPPANQQRNDSRMISSSMSSASSWYGPEYQPSQQQGGMGDPYSLTPAYTPATAAFQPSGPQYLQYTSAAQIVATSSQQNPVAQRPIRPAPTYTIATGPGVCGDLSSVQQQQLYPVVVSQMSNGQRVFIIQQPVPNFNSSLMSAAHNYVNVVQQSALSAAMPQFQPATISYYPAVQQTVASEADWQSSSGHPYVNLMMSNNDWSQPQCPAERQRVVKKAGKGSKRKAPSGNLVDASEGQQSSVKSRPKRARVA